MTVMLFDKDLNGWKPLQWILRSVRTIIVGVTACLAIRFRAMYQDQSMGNTCGSTEIKSASKLTVNQGYT